MKDSSKNLFSFFWSSPYNRRTLNSKIRPASLFFIFFLMILGSTFFFVYAKFLKNPVSDQNTFSINEGFLPFSVTVYGRSQETLSARFAFYTLDGDLISSLERSWIGWELKIDCIVVGENDGFLVFPYQIWTDETNKKNSKALFKYYQETRFPQIYYKSDLAEIQKNRLIQLFSIAKTESWMPGIFGSLRHEIVSLRSFEAGREYFFYIDSLGHLSLISQ